MTTWRLGLRMLVAWSCVTAASRAESPAAAEDCWIQFTYARKAHPEAPLLLAGTRLRFGHQGKATASSRISMPEPEGACSVWVKEGLPALGESALQTTLCQTRATLEECWSLSKARARRIDAAQVEVDYTCVLSLTTIRFRGLRWQHAQKEGRLTLERGKPHVLTLDDELRVEILVPAAASNDADQ